MSISFFFSWFFLTLALPEESFPGGPVVISEVSLQSEKADEQEKEEEAQE